METELKLKVVKETEVLLQEYKREYKEHRELTEEEEKLLDDMIDCQIEDAKIRRDEIKFGEQE
jgi:hypothetical protein